MISDISPVNTYVGNGSATTFDFDFYIDDSSQLKVYYIPQTGNKTLLVENVDYSVNEFTPDTSRVNPDFTNGGYIVFPLEGSQYSILANNEKIILQLDIPFSQESEYNNSSLLNLESLEYSLDYLTRLTQILRSNISGAADTAEEAMEMVQSIINTKTGYVHMQITPATVWQVNHGLGKHLVHVTLIDSAGTTFYPPVKYVDENNCEIHLIGSTAGKAYLS